MNVTILNERDDFPNLNLKYISNGGFFKALLNLQQRSTKKFNKCFYFYYY